MTVLTILANATNWGHVGMVTVLGFFLVLMLLVVLIYVLKIFGWVMQPKVKVKKDVDVHETVAHTKIEADTLIPTGDTMAAIALSLHLFYNSAHDEESTKVTLKKVERKYSPWNSKIYGINNLHR